MSDYSGLGDLVAQVRHASDAIAKGDSRIDKRLDSIEANVNELYRKTHRLGFTGDRDDDLATKDAREMCQIRHYDHSPKNDGLTTKEYWPTSGEIDEAMAARRGFRQLLRTGDLAKLGELERKSLSAFSFGTNGFLLPPQLASTVLSCLVYPTDLSGLVDKMTISGPSVRFLIDNAKMGPRGLGLRNRMFRQQPTARFAGGAGRVGDQTGDHPFRCLHDPGFGRGCQHQSGKLAH